MSGVDGDTSYLLHTNLTGAYNCLELARRSGASLAFLSTSRVYPVAGAVLGRHRAGRDAVRAGVAAASCRASRQPGSPSGCRWTGARTLYGATKLAAELLIEEYRAAFGLRGGRSTAAG